MPGIGSDRVLQGCGHQALLMGVSSKGDELCLNSRKRPERSIKNRFYSLYLFIVLFLLLFFFCFQNSTECLGSGSVPYFMTGRQEAER